MQRSWAQRLGRAIYITGYYFILPFRPMSGRLILLLYQEKKEPEVVAVVMLLEDVPPDKKRWRVLDLAPVIPRSLSRALLEYSLAHLANR